MKLTIHKGTHEIGGTCIEIQSENSKILVDFGLPLVDESGKQFDNKTIQNKTVQELIQQKYIPAINGLYNDSNPTVDGILISHSHPDHYGYLSKVHSDIPVYMSNGCKILIKMANYFGQNQCNIKKIKTIKSDDLFQIGDFKIKAFLVDHSGFDAFAYIIECEGKRIFYSGDFRGHGRKSRLFDDLIKNPPLNIDYLIMEGTMIEGESENRKSEYDVEKELVDVFKNNNGYKFIACSSQNIDRIVSIYKACLKTDSIFVIDPYTAFILDKNNSISKNIPKHNWGKNIRVFFLEHSYTNKLAENNELEAYKSAEISFQEIQKNRKKMVIKSSYWMRKEFANNNDLKDSILIYSMWEGYLPKEEEFWNKNNVPILKIYSSGHAYLSDLKKLVKALNPKHIIPNHTFHPEKFKEHFGDKVLLLNDKEIYIVNNPSAR